MCRRIQKRKTRIQEVATSIRPVPHTHPAPTSCTFSGGNGGGKLPSLLHVDDEDDEPCPILSAMAALSNSRGVGPAPGLKEREFSGM